MTTDAQELLNDLLTRYESGARSKFEEQRKKVLSALTTAAEVEIENDRLRSALNDILTELQYPSREQSEDPRDIARRALGLPEKLL